MYAKRRRYLRVEYANFRARIRYCAAYSEHRVNTTDRNTVNTYSASRLQLLLPLLQVVAQVALEPAALLLRLCGVALRLDAPLRELLHLGGRACWLGVLPLSARRLRHAGGSRVGRCSGVHRVLAVQWCIAQ